MITQRTEVRGQRTDSRCGGFTLIEIIITLVVLSIAAVGVMSVFTTGIKSSANPSLVNQAVQLAQGEMDIVIAQKKTNGLDSALISTGTSACILTPLSGACSRSICYVPAGNLNDLTACGATTNYKRVAISISSALTGTVTIVTLLTDY